jgi:hypothetical protein
MNSRRYLVAPFLLGWFFSSFVGASDTGQLYAGMYPDDFWRNAEILNGVASWAGKRVTFAGTFIDASEDTSNIVEKLEQAWQAQSTPFANVEMSGNTSQVARGSSGVAKQRRRPLACRCTHARDEPARESLGV